MQLKCIIYFKTHYSGRESEVAALSLSEEEVQFVFASYVDRSHGSHNYCWCGVSGLT